MLLADAAQAVNGKLYILGGGWTLIGPEPASSAIAILIEVPWDESNKRHQFQLSLVTGDGQPVIVPTPIGDRPLEMSAEFEVGRPPGLKPGTPLGVPFAINMVPLPLRSDTVHEWRLAIDGRTQEDWSVSFTTRPERTK